MPFKKVGDNEYTGPSGKHFNSAQVRLYYSNGGHFPGQKYGEGGMIKGMKPVNMKYAEGGPVLGRTRDFMKEPDPFRDDGTSREGPDKTDQDYGKKGVGGAGKPNPTASCKTEKPVKPRK